MLQFYQFSKMNSKKLTWLHHHFVLYPLKTLAELVFHILSNCFFQLIFLSVPVPPAIINTNSPLSANEGVLYLLLECIVIGNPAPQISWFLPSGEPVNDDPNKYNAQPGTGFLVVYTPSVEKHDGDFTCVASNLLGSVEGTITVIIQGEKGELCRDLG